MNLPFNGAMFGDSQRSASIAALVLHGSDGERRDSLAERLAGVGIPALAINYFGIEECPRAIVEVPVETVEIAAMWLAERTGSRVAVAGHSKGAELALVAASLLDFPFAAVVGWAPSSVAWYGIDFQDPTSFQRSSWSHRGVATPFVPYPIDAAPRQSERGLALLPCYEVALDRDSEGVASAAITIEAACPTLLVSGTDDQMWPSKRMGDMLVERSRARHGPPVRHLVFEGAGHRIAPDQALRPPSEYLDLGGADIVDREAAEEAFKACVEFLRTV